MDKTHLIFTNQELIVKENYKIKSVQYLNILCFVYKLPYVVIKTNDHKEIFVYSSLSSIIKNLPEIFFHCSRVAIVNLLYINAIECILNPSFIHYSNITENIVIPRRKKQELINAFS
jgi:DNA-binding LytR/AlgR family response regulator